MQTIYQPAGTNLDSEPVTGMFKPAFMDIFETLRDYHKQLGYPHIGGSPEEDRRQHCEFCLALHAETTELLDAVPWKPWRPVDYKQPDRTNIAEEIVDIMFFLGSIRELWAISSVELSEVFERKLIENKRRILIGYNKPAEDM